MDDEETPPMTPLPPLLRLDLGAVGNWQPVTTLPDVGDSPGWQPMTSSWTGIPLSAAVVNDPRLWNVFAGSRTIADIDDGDGDIDDDNEDEDDDGIDVDIDPERPLRLPSSVFRRLTRHARFRYTIMLSVDEQNMQEAINRSILEAEFVPNPAPAELVRSLEVAAVSEAGGTCPICQDDLNVGDAHFVFRCKHVMHAPCSTQWFECGRTCPVCMLPPWPVTEEQQTSPHPAGSER